MADAPVRTVLLDLEGTLLTQGEPLPGATPRWTARSGRW